MKPAVEWTPTLLPIVGGGQFPVRQVWCVGRNYADHAREMGSDPEREAPVFFSKPAQCLVSDREIVYPRTRDLHHEAELVVFLAGGGRNLTPAEAAGAIYGYAVGVDLTRRDVQAQAKQAGGPWEMAKGFDQSGPTGPIVPTADWQPDSGTTIALWVNDQLRQQAVLDDMIWPVDELLARLSRDVSLSAGDAVFTGTPAGVGPLLPGDRVRVVIDRLPELTFSVTPGR